VTNIDRALDILQTEIRHIDTSSEYDNGVKDGIEHAIMIIKAHNNMKKKKRSTLDKVLLFCAFSIIVFTIIMIVLFCIFQSVPDTLIVSFFGVFTGEGCICWRIWAKKKGIQLNQSDS